MTLAIVLVSFMILLFLIMWASIWLVNCMTQRFIGSKHHDLEEITEFGRVPQHWTTPYVTKMKQLDQASESKKKINKIKKKAKNTNIRKLNKLIQYINNTRLVDDESTRDQLLEQLRQVRKQQAEGNFNGF